MRVTKSDYCSAVNCNNNRGNCKLSIFIFPKEPERCKQWQLNVRREDLLQKDVAYLHKNCRLCSNHFEDSQFMNATEKKKLVWNAIPTIFNIPNPPPKINLDSARSIRVRKRGLTLPPTTQKPKKRAKTAFDGDSQQTQDDTLLVDNQTAQTGPAVNDCSQDNSPSSTPETIQKDEKQIQAENELQTLRKKIKILKQKKKRLEEQITNKTKICAAKKPTIDEVIEGAAHYLPRNSQNFFVTQLRLSQCKKRGRKWNANDKQIALSLYYHSPKTYRFLSKVFSLPSLRSLQRWVQVLDLTPGFENDLKIVLKKKISSLHPDDRICCLSFDEMALKMNISYNTNKDVVEGLQNLGDFDIENVVATHALVFMIRGLKSNWKQAFAYAFTCQGASAEKLHQLLSKCLDSLEEIGVDMKAIVCDQGPSNVQLFQKKLNVTVEHPFFIHKKKKILCLYDVPHLIKNVRNCLLKYNILFDGNKTASWDHIKQMYELDKQLPLQMAPKLTKKHIELPAFTSMKVKLCTQVFSNSVSAALMAFVSMGKLPVDCSHTAQFVQTLDKLFDVCNSSQQNPSGKEMRYAMTDGSQIKFLQTALGWLDNLVILNCPNKFRCVQGWRLTIQSILLLWEDLKMNNGFEKMCTRRLQQDCLENFFSVIRQRGGCNDSPTTVQFQYSFKQTVLNSLLTPYATANCDVDDDFILCAMNSLHDQVEDQQTAHPNHISDNLTESADGGHVLEYTQDNVVEPITDISIDITYQNVLFYISGFLLKNLFQWHHSCNICFVSLVQQNRKFNNPVQLLTMFKAYSSTDGDFHNLQLASENFLTYVEHCEKVFCDSFKSAMTKNGVRKYLFEVIVAKNIIFPSSCNDSNKVESSVMKLFINTRIHHELKKISASFKSQNKKSRKYLKLSHA